MGLKKKEKKEKKMGLVVTLIDDDTPAGKGEDKAALGLHHAWAGDSQV